MTVTNPFKNIRVKYWPDYLLAVTGTCFIITVLTYLTGIDRAFPLMVIFGGLILFGIGGEIAHYRYSIKGYGGMVSQQFSGWRHTFLANSFALLGILLTFYGGYKIF
jgi:hypothetical protein